jgi:thymidylate synthase
VAWKTAIKEMLRFYVERSNNVQGLKIWDEWMREDGTIGKAYGYQLGKKIIVGHEAIDSYDGFPMKLPIMSNQVHKLIDGLKNDPASRRHIISLWNIDDLWDMALYPCVWHSQWLVKEGTLHGIVGIRSNDMALGNPFNVFQYYVLQRMLAQVTGYKTGSLTFNINDAHIYERHVEPLKEQIFFEPFQAPKLWINPQVTNFDDFTVNDFVLVHPSISNEDLKDLNRDGALANAWYESHPSITLEVSI